MVKNCKEILPKYFGFEGAGILLRDVKTDFLFSINELSRDESEMILRKEFRDSHLDEKVELNGLDESEKQILKREQEFVDATLYKYRKTKQITFPNDRGVSGIAFNTGEIMHTN